MWKKTKANLSNFGVQPSMHKVIHISSRIKIHGRCDGSQVEGGRLWATRPLETIEVIARMVGHHHYEAVDVG